LLLDYVKKRLKNIKIKKITDCRGTFDEVKMSLFFPRLFGKRLK